MKLSKKFIELIEKEDNEQGDILLAMIDEPENTREDIVAAATTFLMETSDYDGNVLELNRYIALNLLSDDEEEEDEEEYDELTMLDILAADVDPDDEDFNDWDDEDDDEED